MNHKEGENERENLEESNARGGLSAGCSTGHRGHHRGGRSACLWASLSLRQIWGDFVLDWALYGVNAYAIARANGIANPNRIYAGQVLLIPTCNYSGYYPYPTYDYSGYYYPYDYSYTGYPSCYPYYYCWSPYYLDP